MISTSSFSSSFTDFRLVQFMKGKEDKIVVVVGTVIDDILCVWSFGAEGYRTKVH